MHRIVRVRALAASAALALVTTTTAYAQAPSAGLVALDLPSSARTMALGNAWVAGRDNDVVFYNPAQLIAARGSEFAFALTRNSRNSKQVTLGSSYAAGKWSLTFGWGVQFADFHADATRPYPFTSDTVFSEGLANGSTALVVVGGAFVYKGFRIGASGKYASDHVTPLAIGDPGIREQALLADLGVARNMFGGTFAGSVQNLGHAHAPDGTISTVPLQVLFGYSMNRSVGPVDLAIVSQGLVRSGWVSPAGGLDVSYSWIEGYSVSARVGARRPEFAGEWPVTFGAALTADRLTVEYGVQILPDGRAANGVVVRWR